MGDRMQHDQSVTPICWIQPHLRADGFLRPAVAHLQGFLFGKVERTACGISYRKPFTFDCGEYPLQAFDQCQRCKRVMLNAIKRKT